MQKIFITSKGRWNILKTIIFYFLLINFFPRCNKNENIPGTNSIISISIDKSIHPFIIRNGINKSPLSVSGKKENGTSIEIANEQISWVTSNQEIASIDAFGTLQALSRGRVKILAEYQSFKDSIDLLITEFLPSNKTVFYNAQLITMNNEKIIENQQVLVEDGLITKIGQEVEVPPGVKEIDARGKFLIPGLMDMHVHPFFETDLLLYIANGVTSVLDMGNSRNFNDAKNWKNRVRQGQLKGPNIYVSAMVRGSSDGGAQSSIAMMPSEGRNFVDLHRDFDFIKVYNGIQGPTFDAIVDQASNYGLSVIGHGVRDIGISGGLERGQKMIAHAEEFLYAYFNGDFSDEKVNNISSELRLSNAYITGTLSTFEAVSLVWGKNEAGYNALKSRPGYSFTNPLDKPDWDRQFNSVYNQSGSQSLNFQRQKTFLKQFHDSGIPLLLGTDSPIIIGMAAGFSIHDELRIYASMDISNFEVLKMGTVNAGKFIKTYTRNSENFGKIEIDHRADLILLDQNPLSNLNNLRNPVGVMVNGIWYWGDYLQTELDKLRN